MPISDLYGNGMDSPSELKMMPSVASFASHQLQHQPSSAALIPKFEVQDLSTPSEITLPEFAPTRKSVFWGPELDTIVGGSKSANRKSLFVPEPQTKRLSQLITPEEAELVVFDEEGHEIKVEITGDEVVEGFVVSEPSN